MAEAALSRFSGNLTDDTLAAHLKTLRGDLVACQANFAQLALTVGASVQPVRVVSIGSAGFQPAPVEPMLSAITGPLAHDRLPAGSRRSQ